jgi:flavin-dependent dehydrogenase
VVQLRRWGLLEAVLASGAPAIRRVTFTTAEECVTRAIKYKSGVDLLVAPCPYILDTVVADAAAGAGVDVRFGVTVTGVCLDDAGRACGVYGHDATGAPLQVDARFVVGADGLRSRVARSVRAEVVEQRGDGGATQYAYFDGLSWDGIELIAAERALTGVFPTHDGQACIWICSPRNRHARGPPRSRNSGGGIHRLPAAYRPGPRGAAGRRMADLPVTGMLRMPNQIRRAHGPGWALVGDAGYHRDAVTGHGLSDAYRDAELLATALHRALRGDTDDSTALAGYQKHRDRALRDIFEITCTMSSYPPVPAFVELQKQLGAAIDTEATELAASPVPGRHEFARV